VNYDGARVCADYDCERLSLVHKTKSGKWTVKEDIRVTQDFKNDVVKFNLHSPLNRCVCVMSPLSMLLVLLITMTMMIMMMMVMNELTIRLSESDPASLFSVLLQLSA